MDGGTSAFREKAGMSQVCFSFSLFLPGFLTF